MLLFAGSVDTLPGSACSVTGRIVDNLWTTSGEFVSTKQQIALSLRPIMAGMTYEIFLFPLFVAFLATVFVQLLFYWLIFSRPVLSKPRIHVAVPPVSVVICAKNEDENLKKNLPFFLSQDYPEFEVVVVNDASDDDSYYLLKLLAEKHPNLKVVNLIERPNFFIGKKFPLSIGIKSASYEHLLLVDADCKPATDLWIKQMMEGYAPQTEMVLGYGAYEAEPGITNKLIRFDTLHTAIQYLSLAVAGMPYMGVGRNLSYKKGLFYKNNGFISHYQVVSGDDDLFVNQVATGKNTRVVIGMNNRTISNPKKSFVQWVRQRRRHLTTGRFYKTKHKVVLAGYSASQFLFYGLLIALLITLYQWPYVAGAAVLRFATQFFVIKKWMKRLNERNFLLLSPILELFTMILTPVLMFTNPMFRQGKWK